MSLVEDLVRLSDPFTTPLTINYVPPSFDGFGFTRQIVYWLFQLVPVVLVAHIFARTGESMRRIGFDRTRPRFDLSVGLGLAIGAHVAAVGATLAAKALDVPFRPLIGVNADAPTQAIVLLFVVAIVAGITEEVIVTGYVITRLRDLDWSPVRAVVASTLLRASYHLYQGVGGFVANLFGGAVAGLIFIRTKRVMPLVVAHVLIDVIAFLGDFFFGEHLSWMR